MLAAKLVIQVESLYMAFVNAGGAEVNGPTSKQGAIATRKELEL